MSTIKRLLPESIEGLTPEELNQVNLEGLTTEELANLRGELSGLRSQVESCIKSDSRFIIGLFKKREVESNRALLASICELEGKLREQSEVIKKREKVEWDKRMKGLSKDFERALFRMESILIVGIDDKTVLEFIKNKNCSRDCKIIDVESIKKMTENELHKECTKKLIITGANDLSNKELKDRLWWLRSWSSGIGSDKHLDQLIVISEGGRQEDTCDYHSAYVNFMEKLFTEDSQSEREIRRKRG